jgi:O-antigen ligase
MRVAAQPAVSHQTRLATIRLVVLVLLPFAAAVFLSLILRSRPSTYALFLACFSTIGVLLVLCILRKPLVGLWVTMFATFLLEALPNQVDQTSAYTWLLHANLSNWSGLPIAVSPFLIMLLLTGLSWIVRAGLQGRPWPPLGTLGVPVLIVGACVLVGVVYGSVLNGGDRRLGYWEVRSFIYFILAFFLVSAILRSANHLKLLSWAMVVALVLNAVRLAMRSWLLPAGFVVDENTISGTAHENALFLAMLIAYFLAHLTFGRWDAQRWVLLLSMPIVVYALLISERRAAFVVLFAGAAVWATALYLRRRALFWKVMPVLVLISMAYLAAFWNQPESTLGQPVRAVQSVFGVGPRTERDESSNLYRITEEYNVWRTIRDHPLTGIGFGKSYSMYAPMVVLSWWETQFLIPHNQVFWLWLKMGVFGFVSILWLFGQAMARGAQLLRSVEAEWLTVIVLVIMYPVMLLIFSYVDHGFANDRAMVVLGFALGALSRLPALLALPAPVALAATAPTPVAIGVARPAVVLGAARHHD